MREKELHNVDCCTNKLVQRAADPLDYQQEVLNAPRQAVQYVTHQHEPGGVFADLCLDYLRWLLVALEMLFLLRFCLTLLGVDPSNPFVVFLYTLTSFFLSPFEGIVPSTKLGVGYAVIEWSTLVGMAVYAVLFYLVKLLLHTVISKPEEPFQHTEKRDIHAVEEREQVGKREIHSDDSVLSITSTREREASLVNHHVGDYTLIRQLGRGGYAKVYLGKHNYLQTRVALKLLDLILAGDKEVKHFLFEASILAHLRHPHIVRMLDFGWDEDIPFMVMEYAAGGTLYDYFPPRLPLPMCTILPFVLQIASALQYMHNHGLIHCDVKPENVLLGPNEEVWLSDFGIAQSTTATSSKQPSANEVVGTLRYMAPEQISGNPLPASDQYALALMIYQWLCGQVPFQGTIQQVCFQQLNTPPPRLRDLVPSISRPVEQVVLKALAKNPQQRFAHVQEFAYALKQASQAERKHEFLRSMT